MVPLHAAQRVLLVEDEFFIAEDIATAFLDVGHAIAGIVGTVTAALRALDALNPDLVVLDINLAGEMSFPVACALHRADVPFVFVTGYEPDIVPPALSLIPVWRKPFDAGALARFAAKLLVPAGLTPSLA